VSEVRREARGGPLQDRDYDFAMYLITWTRTERHLLGLDEEPIACRWFCAKYIELFEKYVNENG
jgi:hypothetical protein